MCPHCGESMVLLDLHGVQIDYCTECGGTWLDAGELDMLLHLEGIDNPELDQHILPSRSGSKGKRRCPRCRKKMIIQFFDDEKPVEIDTCPRGHGTWLDQGEMYQIIHHYQHGKNGAVARFFASLYAHTMKETKELV